MAYNPGISYDTQSLSRGIEQGAEGIQQGLRNYQANKLMAGQAIAKFEATVAADPSILQFLETDKAPTDISSAYNALKKGGNVPFAKAAQLSQYAETFTKQKEEAQQRQMRDAQLKQFLQQQSQDNLARQYGMGQGTGVLSPQLQNNPFFKINAQAQAAGLGRPTVDNILDFQAKEDARKTRPALDLKSYRSADASGKPIQVTVDQLTGKQIGSGPLQDRTEVPDPLNLEIYKTLDTERKDLVIPALNTITAYDNIQNVLKNSDIISGKFANAELGLRKLVTAIGGKSDPKVTDTEVVRAQFAVPVFQIIKNLGSGTGISDADREFAGNAAGGNLTLDAGAIKRLAEIGKRASEITVKNYKKRLDSAFSADDSTPTAKRARASLLLAEGDESPSSIKESGGTSASDILSEYGIKPR